MSIQLLKIRNHKHNHKIQFSSIRYLCHKKSYFFQKLTNSVVGQEFGDTPKDRIIYSAFCKR